MPRTPRDESQDPAEGGARPFNALEGVLSRLVEERRQADDVFDAMQQDTFLIRGGGVGIRLESNEGGYRFQYVSTPLSASMYEDEASARRVANMLIREFGEEIPTVDVISAREATEEAVAIVRETVTRLKRFGLISDHEHQTLLEMDDQQSVSSRFASAEELIYKRHQAHVCALSSRVPTEEGVARVH